MHMVIHSNTGIIHNALQPFHNLKKFSAISLSKYTPVVHKDLAANILWGYPNHRMRFSLISSPRPFPLREPNARQQRF